MKKITLNLILIVFLIIFSSILILSTIGIETDKFNNIISKKIKQTNNSLNLKLTTVKFKLDIKEVSLFLETPNPEIYYRNITMPTKNIKVYMNFLSLIKADPKIKKINLVLYQLDISQLKKLSIIFKPSNFRSLLNNKIKGGKLNIQVEVYLNDNNQFENFIARGSVTNLKAEIIDNLNLQKTNFSFFADKTDVLIKNIFGETGPIKIKEGDIKLKLLPEVSLETNFKTSLKYNDDSKDYLDLIKNFNYSKNLVSLEAELNNSFSISLDDTYKVKNYSYRNNGKIISANLDFKKPLESFFLSEKINKVLLSKSEIKTNYTSKKNDIYISGEYSLNSGNFLSFNLENIINKELMKIKIDAEYDKPITLDLINYYKPKDLKVNLSLDIEKNKEKISIKKINLSDNSNLIFVEDLKLDKKNFLSFKSILVKTIKDGKINNDFSVLFGKKIVIKGSKFDASNLPKFLNLKASKNKFLKINKEVEIDFASIIAPLSENLKNFKLIGEVKKGKFTKISSKGDFGNNNFLDIKMKNDKNNKKKYLEVYSDLPKPLLTEYAFFKGLTGGKLLYTSTIDGENSNSKLKIENFKVINAPGVVKLLSLADLGGLADLAEGEGLSFDILEININKNKNILNISEILALGPSISVLMEGYQDQNGLTSLRGTMIPAKTLNKMISKIPILGNIIIPKEVGEGLFGISFKMKGEQGKIKTTINPIRTITPRFIQKIIDRNKDSK
jgi:hypothetical protein